MDNNYNYSWQKRESTKKKRGKGVRVLSVACLALMFGLIAGVVFVGINALGGRLLGSNESGYDLYNDIAREEGDYYDEYQYDYGDSSLAGSRLVVSDVSDIVEYAMPSIVSISNLSIQQVRDFFGDTYNQEVEGAGTGIIVNINDEELLIVTNAHVVEGSETLTVTFNDDEIIEAMIKGVTPGYDLAILAIPIESIPSATLDVIRVATIGDSNALRMGEPAIAIGNSLGYGQTVTKGVISALNRISTAPQYDPFAVGMYDYVELIQTDAAINPGNSGGPLMNARGEVIGINSSKLVGMSIEGIGYAIPISDVTDILDELMNRVTRDRVPEDERGFLGIFGETVSTEDIDRHNMPRGVYISEVIHGSPAFAAGLREGDIITGLDGSTVTSMVQLQSDLQFYAAGDTVTLTIQTLQRDGGYETTTVEVVLGERD